MIWSWGRKGKWCTKRCHPLTESPGAERGRTRTQAACPREQSLFFIHCCVLNVRSIIKCGSIKYYWKTKLNWRARYSHWEETSWEHPHKTKARGEEAWQGHRTASSTQFPTAFLLWEERHPPKGQMSAGPGHCPRLSSSAFPDFTDIFFPNG